MKGIIVVDKIPESCRNIRGEKEIGCPFGGMYCHIKQKDVMEYLVVGKKPDWCPIKPVPEKKEFPECFMYGELYGEEIGWNACIDEILKEE